jgi:hypothetical protein
MRSVIPLDRGSRWRLAWSGAVLGLADCAIPRASCFLLARVIPQSPQLLYLSGFHLTRTHSQRIKGEMQ